MPTIHGPAFPVLEVTPLWVLALARGTAKADASWTLSATPPPSQAQRSPSDIAVQKKDAQSLRPPPASTPILLSSGPSFPFFPLSLLPVFPKKTVNLDARSFTVQSSFRAKNFSKT
jgi:hypothetical protein